MNCLDNTTLSLMPTPVKNAIRSTYYLIRHGEEFFRSEKDSWNDLLYRSEFANLTVTAAHVGLASLGALAVYEFGVALPVALVLSSIVSLPATLLVGGGAAMYFGGAAIVSSLASGSLTTLGLGLACAAGGWFILDNYRIAPLINNFCQDGGNFVRNNIEVFHSLGLAEYALVHPLAKYIRSR